MKKSLMRKAAALVITGFIVLPGIWLAIDNVMVAYADTQSDLNDAKDKKKDINEQIKDTQDQIAQLQKEASDAQAYITQLDSKMSELDNSLVTIRDQIDAKEQEITDTETKLTKAEEDSKAQYEAMKLRIKFMYEHNDESYMEILVSSKNMGDLLNKTEYITKISQYDRSMLDKYKETVTFIANAKKQLEDDHAKMTEMKDSLEGQKAVIRVVQDAKAEELSKIADKKSEAQEKEAALHADLAAQEQEIQAMEAEIKQEEERRAREAEEAARKAALANSSGTNGSGTSGTGSSGGLIQYNGGAFLWPTISRRITSDWGDTEDRPSPHKGVDIGACTPGVAGDPIYAAADGEVALAQYSASAGNWIWIYHGDGVYSVYMHCSSLGVSKGQTVKKGQVIARMGTTGNSTGVHLHFGVRKNGVYVNPWSYLG